MSSFRERTAPPRSSRAISNLDPAHRSVDARIRERHASERAASPVADSRQETQSKPGANGDSHSVQGGQR